MAMGSKIKDFLIGPKKNLTIHRVNITDGEEEVRYSAGFKQTYCHVPELVYRTTFGRRRFVMVREVETGREHTLECTLIDVEGVTSQLSTSVKGGEVLATNKVQFQRFNYNIFIDENDLGVLTQMVGEPFEIRMRKRPPSGLIYNILELRAK